MSRVHGARMFRHWLQAFLQGNGTDRAGPLRRAVVFHISNLGLTPFYEMRWLASRVQEAKPGKPIPKIPMYSRRLSGRDGKR